MVATCDVSKHTCISFLQGIVNVRFFFCSCGAAAQCPAMTFSFLRFLDHTQRRVTVGRTPLDEWSARRRDLYLTTHNAHDKHPCPGGIRTHDLSRRAAADLRLRPRDQWDCHECPIYRSNLLRFNNSSNVMLGYSLIVMLFDSCVLHIGNCDDGFSINPKLVTWKTCICVA